MKWGLPISVLAAAGLVFGNRSLRTISFHDPEKLPCKLLGLLRQSVYR